MLNKEQYDILSLIKTHNVTNPITAIDIVNRLQIAKEQVGMAKLDAKWSKTFAIVSIAISVFSLAVAFAGFVFTHLI